MDLYVADKQLQTLDLIDYSSSIIWHTLYCGAGDFEIVVPANKTTMLIMQRDNFIYRNEDDIAMIIEKVILQTDEETGDQLIVSGRSAESLFARRIVWGQQTFSGLACECVKKILNDNVISPTNTLRKIPLIEIGPCAMSTSRIQKQMTGDVVLDAVIEVLSTYGLGFKLKRNFSRLGGSLSFQITKGVDRSKGNADNNPHVIFSGEFDNLLASEYLLDYTNYKNNALVGGEGEGAERTYQEVNSRVSGFDRYELFVDARAISSNNGEISQSDYLAQLTEEGAEKLSEQAIVETFNGEIEPSTTYTYDIDYGLGDIVQIENDYGLSSKVRIIGVTENANENGNNLVLTYQNI